MSVASVRSFIDRVAKVDGWFCANVTPREVDELVVEVENEGVEPGELELLRELVDAFDDYSSGYPRYCVDDGAQDTLRNFLVRGARPDAGAVAPEVRAQFVAHLYGQANLPPGGEITFTQDVPPFVEDHVVTLRHPWERNGGEYRRLSYRGRVIGYQAVDHSVQPRSDFDADRWPHMSRSQIFWL
jgi:hypothetical protein